jgi:DNA recombination protein RmuC
MNIAAVVLALLLGLAGVCLGWFAARQRLDSGVTQALGEANRARAELAEARSDAAAAWATLDAERAGARERETTRGQDEQRIRDAFAAVAGDALAKNNEAFMTLAETRIAAAKAAADGDLGQRQQAIENLVAPLRQSLDNVTNQLNSVEKERVGSYSALLEQISTMRQTSEQLRSETTQLVTALRAPQVRGRWGELQLERAVEAAGMTEHIDYVTQASATGASGTVRPDMVVNLVGGKRVVVDSKVAFSGYLEAMEARDEQTKAARLKAHARHLRDHIDSLAGKAYWESFTPTPEFVVCFVPADAFLDAALREDPSLLEHAFKHNVVIATPSTLIALLRTVAYTWRQEALAANAKQVHDLGRELYQRLSTMGTHVDKLGRSLNSAVSSYNSTVSSLETRVLVTARRMTELKVVSPEESLDPPKQITENARSAQSPELAAQRVVALPKQRTTVGQIELLSDVSQTS